jgi:tetratricopeptide (TPR) repeat protein
MHRKLAIGLVILVLLPLIAQTAVQASGNSEKFEQLSDSASLLYEQGKYREAKSVWQKALVEALKIGPKSDEVVIAYDRLALTETRLANPEAALSMYKRQVAILQSISANDPISIAEALTSEAECLRKLKRYDEAEKLYKTALPTFEQAKKSDLYTVSRTLNGLALCYQNEGKFKEAEETFHDARVKAESLGPNENKALQGMIFNNLGSLYMDEKKLPEAEEAFASAIFTESPSCPEDAFATAVILTKMTMLAKIQGQTARADKLLKDSIELVKTNLITGKGGFSDNFKEYVASLISMGRNAEADDILRFRNTHNPETISTVIQHIGGNPKLVEKRLRMCELPSAKAYLAYLYLTRKVVIPNRSRKVDRLMNDAIADLTRAPSYCNVSLGSINPDDQYHYTDIALLLEHLRFITDADNLGGPVPDSIFKDYPVAAFKAFDWFYGGSGDAWIHIAFDPREDIQRIPAVARFIKILDELLGDTAPRFYGTYQNSLGRQYFLTLKKASLAPQIFLANAKKEVYEIHPQLNSYMQFWSNQELWNKVKYGQWLHSGKDAEAALARHYNQHFGFTEKKARICAKTAIAAINTTYLGTFTHEPFETTVASPVYKIFRRHGLTLQQMQRALHGQSLSRDQLGAALRLAILNDGSLDVINWLLKQHAPLAGNREPILFSSVLRPEVVDLLLKVGVDVNETNALGKTAMFQACQFNSPGSVKKLHAAGAQIGDKMESLDDYKSSDLKNNCDYNYTVGGRTPLMYAAAFAGSPVIRYLVDHGADKSVVDSSGKTAEKYLANNRVISKVERRNLATILHPHELKESVAPAAASPTR